MERVAAPMNPASRRALRKRRARSRMLVLLGAGSVVLALGLGAWIVGAGGAAGQESERSSSEPDAAAPAPAVTALPVPAQTGTSREPAGCETEAVQAALVDGSDADVIAAFGGGEAVRAAVAAQRADCIDLHDASRLWVVANKRNALEPLDYWPTPQAQAAGVPRTSGGHMRSDVADALAELVATALAEGAGQIGVNSGFRSYDYQVGTYQGYVNQLGQAGADRTSARPGHSEHQTGLAVDVIACGPACGGIEAFGGTPQSDWVAANAWRFGFIVRYEQGFTDITGYEAEPWHLRYIGVDLATAYHDGGYRTFEDFFGLDPAPDYG